MASLVSGSRGTVRGAGAKTTRAKLTVTLTRDRQTRRDATRSGHRVTGGVWEFTRELGFYGVSLEKREMGCRRQRRVVRCKKERREQRGRGGGRSNIRRTL